MNEQKTIKVSSKEFRLLKFTRGLGYGEVRVNLVAGEPIGAESTIKKIRFDTQTEIPGTIDIEEE